MLNGWKDFGVIGGNSGRLLWQWGELFGSREFIVLGVEEVVGELQPSSYRSHAFRLQIIGFRLVLLHQISGTTTTIFLRRLLLEHESSGKSTDREH